MTVETCIRDGLSLSGSVSITLDAGGLWRATIRRKGLAASYVAIEDDPIKALRAASQSIAEDELVEGDAFERAERARQTTRQSSMAISRTRRSSEFI